MPRERSISTRRNLKPLRHQIAAQLYRHHHMNPFVALQRTFTCVARPAMSTQFNNPEHSDLVVRVAGQRWHVHKLVLSSGSPVFAAMLGGDWSERGHRELNLGDESNAAHFSAFLRFFYTGEIHMTAASLPNIYMLADKYFVRPLLEDCTRHLLRSLRIRVRKSIRSQLRGFEGQSLQMQQRFLSEESEGELDVLLDDAGAIMQGASLSSNSVVDSSAAAACSLDQVTASEVLPISSVVALLNCSVPQIARSARLNILVRVAQEVRHSIFTNFIALPFELLLQLCSDDCFDCGEYQLFQAIRTWFRDCDIESSALRIQSASALYRQVRFALMSAEELYDCETEGNSGPVLAELSNELGAAVSAAVRHLAFRSCSRARSKESWNGVLFRPRQFFIENCFSQMSTASVSNPTTVNILRDDPLIDDKKSSVFNMSEEEECSSGCLSSQFSE